MSEAVRGMDEVETVEMFITLASTKTMSFIAVACAFVAMATFTAVYSGEGAWPMVLWLRQTDWSGQRVDPDHMVYN